MSAKSWLKKFYPIPANKTRKSEALDHSILKWRGLQDSHLQKHGLYRDYQTVRDLNADAEVLKVNARTCALCVHFFGQTTAKHCTKCPLFISRNGVKCDDYDSLKDQFSIYADFLCGDPKPMLAALKKAKRDARRRK